MSCHRGVDVALMRYAQQLGPGSQAQSELRTWDSARTREGLLEIDTLATVFKKNSGNACCESLSQIIGN